MGSLPLLLLTVIALVKLAVVGWKDKNVWYIMVFLLAYAIQANISGSLWNCPALLAALGYGLSLPMSKHKKRLSPKQ